MLGLGRLPRARAGPHRSVTAGLGMRQLGAMLTRGQAEPDEVIRTLARARSALGDLRAETQRTAAEHERMAAWYAERGDQAYAQMERRTAAVQRQLLADLDAAFEALEAAVSAVLELDR
jgi:hypothetical protein